MLNCTVCGHDNFPFTNTQIRGWAQGNSLQMVSRCHRCGARVAEPCTVCGHLHPLNTTHCSLHGISMADYRNSTADLRGRIEAFIGNKNVLSEVDGFRKSYNRLSLIFLGLISIFAAPAVFLIYNYADKSIWGFVGLFFMIIAFIFFVILLFGHGFKDENLGRQLRSIWEKSNSEKVNFWVRGKEISYSQPKSIIFEILKHSIPYS